MKTCLITQCLSANVRWMINFFDTPEQKPNRTVSVRRIVTFDFFAPYKLLLLTYLLTYLLTMHAASGN